MATTDSLDNVLQSLTTLSNEELDQVVSKCRFLKSSVGATFNTAKLEPRSDDDHELLMLAITEFFQDHGLEYTQPGVLKKANQYSSFKAGANSTYHFFRSNVPNLSKTELLGFLRLGVELLYNNMVKIGIPTSTRTLMGQVHRIPSVINKSFPGYAASGTLAIIIRREVPREQSSH